MKHSKTGISIHLVLVHQLASSYYKKGEGLCSCVGYCGLKQVTNIRDACIFAKLNLRSACNDIHQGH